MFGHIKAAIRYLRVLLLRIRSGFAKEEQIEGTTLILAPHPDDECIGCSGLIARLVREGNPPHIIIMTGGEASHRGCCNIPEETIIRNRRLLTMEAVGVLGVSREYIHFLDFEDGSISQNLSSEIVRIRNIISQMKPKNILLPHSGEGWADHLATRSIGLNLASADCRVWEYCVWMWYYNVWHLDWKNARILRMKESEYKLKLRAMDVYVKPIAPCGKPWSGVLPSIFLWANKWNKELFFKVK